ncbi:MAG: hypothetical protein EXR69_07580 [Myxococcales bacterium]|nr:hypothetical protein [Myxococcales bacterium]
MAADLLVEADLLELPRKLTSIAFFTSTVMMPGVTMAITFWLNANEASASVTRQGYRGMYTTRCPLSTGKDTRIRLANT